MTGTRSTLARDYLDPYVIAEIGVNHEGSMERAKSLILSAKRGGAHAAKFQSYKADTLASKHDSPSYWDTSKEPTRSQHELFSKLDTFGPDEFLELARFSDSVGVDFMSTPFDLDAVEYLNPVVSLHKVASADLTNVPLLRAIGSTAKPVILSVGAGTRAEMETAVDILLGAGASEVCLLHCVLNYPTPPASANLAHIKTLVDAFGGRCSVGYSDHVAPDGDGGLPALEMASLFGAQVIEKHFTDDRQAPGNDHYHAADEEGLLAFTAKLASYRTMLGSGEPELHGQSAALSNARRRIFTARALPSGHILTESDLIALRANVGVPVAEWDGVVGLTTRRALEQGAPVNRTDVS